MKYFLRLIVLFALLPGTISAGTPSTWLFKVFTYDAQGQLKGEGNGFFLDEKLPESPLIIFLRERAKPLLLTIAVKSTTYSA